MKHIKYISFLVLIILMTTGKVFALKAQSEICYYMSDSRDFKAKLVVYTGDNYKNSYQNAVFTDVYINKVGAYATPINNPENVNNWVDSIWKSHTTTSKGETPAVKFPNLYESGKAASENGKCPAYLVFQYCNVYKVWGTDEPDMANNAIDAIKSNSKCVGYKAKFQNSTGKKYTEEEYYGEFINKKIGGTETKLDCGQLFGNVKYAGETDTDANGNGQIDPPSLGYIINSALTYVRIIAPILVILLGTLDLAKAVLASKEDQMKKAQSDFFKRIIMGVVIFFVPTIVNVVMKLADIVWAGLDYSSCMLP